MEEKLLKKFESLEKKIDDISKDLIILKTSSLVVGMLQSSMECFTSGRYNHCDKSYILEAWDKLLQEAKDCGLFEK